jgi:transcriptional regulator with XRE-family HTH domain
MKRYGEEDIKHIGMRIKSARALTGNSQSEFCEKYGLSLGAFKTWESGKFAPRMVNLEELCRCFASEGILNASTAWFLQGQGPAPSYVKGDAAINAEELIPDISNEVNDEIEAFQRSQIKLKRETIIIVVTDELMSPYFSKGDIIGGVKINSPLPSDLNNQPFLIELKPDCYVVRWCFSDGESLFFKAPNSSLICRLGNRSVGRLLWHRRF